MSIRVIYDHGRPLTRQDTEKQRLLQAVQAAALVQAALVHRGAGLTIHLDETAAAGRRVPVTGFRLSVDRRAKTAIVLLLRGRFAGIWPARVSRRRPWVRLRRTFRLFTAVAMPRLRAGVTALGVRSTGMPLDGQRRQPQASGHQIYQRPFDMRQYNQVALPNV